MRALKHFLIFFFIIIIISGDGLMRVKQEEVLLRDEGELYLLYITWLTYDESGV